MTNNSIVLTDKNFLLYASKHYDNVQCSSTDEFLADICRVKYIRKLITRYIESGELKERLILNHLIILNNLFGPEALGRILFLKLEDYMRYIKPFLILLNIMPDKVWNVREAGPIDTTGIPMDPNIIKVLRSI
jgi:hypothetical protein